MIPTLTLLARRTLSTQPSLRRRLYSQKATNDKTAQNFSDPWPLPHSPEHLNSTTTPPEELKVPPLPRPNESVDTLRARLLYQTRKRGTLESDLLLSTFGNEWLSKMDEDELKEFDKVDSACLCFAQC